MKDLIYLQLMLFIRHFTITKEANVNFGFLCYI